jgi:hypothetical protein
MQAVNDRRAEKRSVFRHSFGADKDGGRRCAFPPYGCGITRQMQAECRRFALEMAVGMASP